MTRKRPSASLLAWLILVFVLTTPSRAAAQYWPEDAVFPEDPVKVIFTSDYDLFVATVQSVDDSASTQGDPPRLTVRVEEVLFGSLKPGVANVRWLPWAPWIPCAVGEEANIRAWNATPMKGPAVGERMIMAGSTNADGWLEIKPKFHWAYSKKACDHWVQLVRTWTPRVEARRRREAAQRSKEARLAKEAAIRKENLLRQHEQAWFDDQARIIAAAHFDGLVQAATDIAIGTFEPVPGARPGWQPLFRIERWLRRSQTGGDSTAAIYLYFGQREDSLLTRWKNRPPDLLPGSKQGDPVRCIAFLKLAHDSLYYSRTPVYRPIDPLSGLMLCSARAERKAQGSLARSASESDHLDCEADLREFTGLGLAEAAGVGIKFSSTPPHWPASFPHSFPRELSLVVACPTAGEGMFTTVNASWFAPCRLPSNRYVQDFQEASWNTAASPAEMQALLDSLGNLASFRHPRFAPDDSVTLMIRRVQGGQERVYETTLDHAMFHDVVEVLAGIFVGAREPIPPGHGTGPDSARRSSIASWTYCVDRSCESIWLAHPEKYTLLGN